MDVLKSNFRFSIVDIVEAPHDIGLKRLGLIAQHRPSVSVGTGNSCPRPEDASQGESPLFVVDEGIFSEDPDTETFYLYAEVKIRR
jgi:hypothetical protein